jgi:hypothetical protein
VVDASGRRGAWPGRPCHRRALGVAKLANLELLKIAKAAVGSAVSGAAGGAVIGSAIGSAAAAAAPIVLPAATVVGAAFALYHVLRKLDD